MKRFHFLLIFLCGWVITLTGPTHAEETVPPEHFHGTWKIQSHYFRFIREGETDFENLGEEQPKDKSPQTMEIRFRRHKTGAIQRIWTDATGKVVRSKGITILEQTTGNVVFRVWSDHRTWKDILKTQEDGTLIFQTRSLKHQETFFLTKTDRADNR